MSKKQHEKPSVKAIEIEVNGVTLKLTPEDAVLLFEALGGVLNRPTQQTTYAPWYPTYYWYDPQTVHGTWYPAYYGTASPLPDYTIT